MIRRGRISSIPGPSISIVAGPVARFDVPIRTAGSKAIPSIGQARPVLRPVTGPSGKSETVSPASVGSAMDGGARQMTSCAPSSRQGRSGSALRTCSTASW